MNLVTVREQEKCFAARLCGSPLHNFLRRIIPNGDIGKYMATTHQGFALHYRPHDMYVGNLVTALGCIDAGITCIIDNSHNSRSSAHSDAAIQALIDAGIRAVHASGAPASDLVRSILRRVECVSC